MTTSPSPDADRQDADAQDDMKPTPARMTVVASVVASCLAVVFVIGAPSAGADGVRPSNFSSVIDSVDPSPSTVQIEIVGGDSFLQVTADPGTEVLVAGYDGEPYLRILADGSVERNERSPATYLNISRSGDVDRFPAGVSGSAEPDWQRIGSDGRVAWHDHRIHWMLDDAPAADQDGVVQAWTLPLQVDGEPVIVQGRLLIYPNVVPWAALVAAAAALGAVVVSRRPARRAPLLLGASVVALMLAVATFSINPPGAEPSQLPLILPALAAVLSAVATLAPTVAGVRSRTPRATHAVGLVLPLAAAAALIGWVIAQIGVVWMPTVPSAWAPWLTRAGAGMVLGIAVGVAIAVVSWPVLTGSDTTPSTRTTPPPAQ